MSEPGDKIRCAVCARPVDDRYRPFCSRRCADVDLQRWLTGRYAVPAVEDDGDAEQPEENG